MLTGGCTCGAVRYEIEAPLIVAGYCHCTRCQRRSGSGAEISGRVAPGSFQMVAGEELVRSWQPDDGLAECFCGECGSALWSRHPEERELLFVRLGTFDGDPGIRPSYRQFVAYAAPWELIPDDGCRASRSAARPTCEPRPGGEGRPGARAEAPSRRARSSRCSETRRAVAA